MSGKLKKILIGLAVFLIVGGAGAYFLLPSTINWGGVSQDIAEKVGKITGTRMVVSGEPVFSMRSTPTLKFKRVEIKNAAGASAPNLLVAPSMEITLDSGALFRRKAIIKKITFVKPELFVEQLEDGQWNYRFGFLNSRTQPPDFRFESILISEAAVTVKKRGKPERKLDNFNVEIFADSLQGPFSLEGTVKLQEDNWRFSIKTPKLEKNALPSFSANLIHVPSETILSFSGGFSQREESVWEGSVNFDVRKTNAAFKMFFPEAELAGDFFAELSGNTTARINLETGAFAVKDLLFKYGESSASGQLTFTRETAGTDEAGAVVIASSLEGALNVSKFSANPFAAHGGQFAVFAAKYVLPAFKDVKTNVKVNMDTFEYNRDNVRYVKFTVADADGTLGVNDFEMSFPGNSLLKGRAEMVSVNGAPLMRGTADLASDNVGTALRWMNAPLPEEIPQNLLRSLSLKTHFSFSLDELSFSGAEFKIDLTEGKGAGTFGLGERNDIYIAADVNELNFDAYFPEKRNASKMFVNQLIQQKSGAEKVKMLFEKLAFLNTTDLRLDISSQLVTWADTKMQNVVVKTNVKNGMMIVEDLSSTDFFKSSVSLKGYVTGFGSMPTFSENGLDIVFETRQFKSFGKDIGMELPKNFERFTGSDSILLKGNLSGALTKLNVNMFAGFGKFSFDAAGNIDLTPNGVDFEMGVSRLKHDNFRNFVRFFAEGYRPAGQKPVAMTFVGRVVKKADDYHVNMNAGTQIDGKNLTGVLDIRREPQKKTVVSADLNIVDALDVAPLLPDMKLTQPPMQSEEKRPVFAFLGDEPLFQKTAPDFSFMGDYLADVRFKAAGLIWQGADFKDVDGALTLNDGKINLSITSAKWNDGALTAKVLLDTREGVAVSSQIDLAAMKSETGVFGGKDFDLSFNQLNLSLTLQASGATAADAFRSLEGKGRLHIDGAAFHKMNLLMITKSLTDRKLPDQATFDTLATSGKTVFDNVTAPIEIMAAKATLQPVELTFDGKKFLQSKVIYDFPSRVLDATFELPVSQNPSAPALKKVISRNENTSSVRSNNTAVLGFFVKEREELDKKLQMEEENRKQRELMLKQKQTEEKKAGLRPLESRMALETGSAKEKYARVVEISKKTKLDAAQIFQMSLDVKALEDFEARVNALLQQEEVNAEEVKALEDFGTLKVPVLKKKIQQMYDIAVLSVSRLEISEANEKGKALLTEIIKKTVKNPDFSDTADEARGLLKGLDDIAVQSQKENDMTALTVNAGKVAALVSQIEELNLKLDGLIAAEAQRLKDEEIARQKALEEQARIAAEKQKAAQQSAEDKKEVKKQAKKESGMVIRRKEGSKVIRINMETPHEKTGDVEASGTSDNDAQPAPDASSPETNADAQPSSSDQPEKKTPAKPIIIRRN